MIINHPCVTSDVFKLIDTFEFDLEVGDHFLPTRIELFRDTERANTFRCRMWERDLYHLRLSLRQGEGRDESEGQDAMESDEEILVEKTWELSSRFESYEAKNAEDALHQFLDHLMEYLNRISSNSSLNGDR